VAKARTKSLPFNWKKFFVPSDTECVLACFAMCARYWGYYFPELGLPDDLEIWKEWAGKSFSPHRGTYIRGILRKMPKTSEDSARARTFH